MSSLEGQDLFILDAGPCPSGIESTVVDVRDAEPRVLRPGALSIPALRAVVPSLHYARIEAGEGASRASPGQDKRHYAPRTPLVVAADRKTALARAHELTERGERVGVVVFGDSLRHDEVDPRAPIHVLPANPEAAGAALFALLYELDRQKYALILVEPPPDAPGWEAIADRIARASVASPNTLGV